MKMSTPEAPNLAEASREGVMADIETLPTRLMADYAAGAGSKFTDPVTGKTYDFSIGTDWKGYYDANKDVQQAWNDSNVKEAYGNDPRKFAEDYYNNIGKARGDNLPTYGGDDAANRRAIAAAMQMAQGGADISRTLEKQRLEDSLGLLPKFNELNLDAQRAAYDASLDAGEEGTRRAYDQQLEFMPKFAQLDLANQANAFEQSLGQGEKATRRMTDLQSELLPGINRLGLDQQALGLEAATAAGRKADPLAAALRDALLKRAQDDLAAGGDLSPEQTMRAQENIRTGQAARGNILGPSANVAEAMALTGYGDDLVAKRQQAAISALGTQPLLPNFTVQNAVNPLLPNFSASNSMPQGLTPNFGATTTGGPNLGAQSVQKGPAMGYLDPSAAQFGANFLNNQWNTKVQDNRAASQQMTSLMSSGMGMAASFI